MPLPTYTSYKNSNLPWLGEIPIEWGLERAKWLFEKEERPVRPVDEIITAFRDGTVTLRKNRRTTGFTNAIEEHGYQGIRKGDLVIHAMDAFAGAIGVSDSEGKSTPVYSVCTPSKEYKPNSYYYAYLLRHMALSGYIQSLAKGIRERSTDFRFSDFANLLLPIPSQEDQERIVTFLDKKTAEIDDAIAKKEKLVDLLQEQKAILINQAVTKGLIPDAPMKDSGVQWIGEVPSHWEVKRLKYYLTEIDERSQTGNEELLSVSHMTGVTPRADKEKIYMFLAADYKGSKLCHAGDLVVNIMWAWMGALGVSDRTGIVSPSYGVYRQTRTKRFTNWFLEHTLRSKEYVAEYNRRSTGLHSSRLRLYSNYLLDMRIASPPINEQTEIEKKLNLQTQNIDSAIASLSQQVTTLSELKQTVISNAVTGKIKV